MTVSTEGAPPHTTTDVPNGPASPLVGDTPLPFPQLCAKIHERVTALLDEKDPSPRIKSVQEQTKTSLRIIAEALDQYTLQEVSLAYNGGKDCLVLLILYLCALHQKGLSTQTNQDGGHVLVQSVYIEAEDPFVEQEEFANSSAEMYSLSLRKYSKPMKAAFADYLHDQSSVKAIFVGTRRTDPHGEHLKPFDPTDSGWPTFMRIHPVIDWHYVDIWTVSQKLIEGYSGQSLTIHSSSVTSRYPIVPSTTAATPH